MPATFNYGLPGPTNQYVPSYDTAMNLIVNYGRNPKDYAVNDIVKIYNVDKQIGFYAKMDPNEYGRVFSNPDRYLWPDGQPLGQGPQELQGSTFPSYFAQRRAVFATLGDMTVEQSVIPQIAQQQSVLANKLMLIRTNAVYNAAFNTNNLLANNIASATQLGGGTFDNATASNNYIQKTFLAVATQVAKATYGAVKRWNLTCVMSPPTAMRIAASQEIRDTIVRQEMASKEVLEGGRDNWTYGLPPSLYGVKILIDDACENLGPRAPLNSDAANPVFPANSTPTYSLLFIVRQGDMEVDGPVATDFSSLGVFMLKGQEMVSEVYDFPWDKYKRLQLWETYAVNVVASECTFVVTSIFSS